MTFSSSYKPTGNFFVLSLSLLKLEMRSMEVSDQDQGEVDILNPPAISNEDLPAIAQHSN